MEPEFKPESKFPKKRVMLWIIFGLVLFGGANALAFSNGYKNFISELKVATIKSWDDISGKDDGFKLVATIPLDEKKEEPIKGENKIVTIPRPRKTISENIKDVATSIQSIPEKLVAAIATSSNLITGSISKNEDATPPPQNENSEPPGEPSKQLSNPVISVVQIRGAKIDNDFVIIFNTNNAKLDVSGWRLRKRTQTGTESSIRVFPDESIIPAYGNYMWANSRENFHLGVNSNTSSTQTLAANNSIALINKDGIVIDSLAWGEGHTNPYIEGSAVPNPEPGILIKRKFNGEVPVDTNDNSQDFLVK